jgi:hypothetical protein
MRGVHYKMEKSLLVLATRHRGSEHWGLKDEAQPARELNKTKKPGENEYIYSHFNALFRLEIPDASLRCPLHAKWRQRVCQL